MKLATFTKLNWYFASFLFVFATLSTSGQTLQTDQNDYPPGDMANITGLDFLPNEIVTLQVYHVDSDGLDYGTDSIEAHAPWDVVADENGNFETTWILPSDGDEAGASLVAIANGQVGSYAEVYFTDAIGTTPCSIAGNANPCAGTLIT